MNLEDAYPTPSQLIRQEEKHIKQFLDAKSLPEKIANYQIISELGRGGMGCVYKAYHSQLDKFIAIKVIKTNNEKEIQRFNIEAQAMAALDHPYIVKVYNFGVENNVPYLIMDFVDGISLKQYLKKPLTIVQILKTMAKISEAIAYAHQKDIIHRDLKPANIMINKTQEPLVMDFGLAKFNKAHHSLSKTGTILGTPAYMSPEQAKGQKVSSLTDVYALGAILYEMLGKKRLIKGSNTANIIYNVLHQEHISLRKINAKIAKDVETICHKAIAREQTQRYQKAQAFSEDIKRFLNGELIEARSANIWEKSCNKFQRNKPIAIAIILGVLLLSAGIWSFTFFQDADIHQHLKQTRKLQQKASKQKNLNKKIEIYIKINNLLEKAIKTSSNTIVVKKLIKTKEKTAMLAKKQKNYLLSYSLLTQCKNLGYKKAEKLLKQLKKEEKELEKNHRNFIAKTMQKIKDTIPTLPQEAINRYFDRYVFSMVKIQRPYMVKTLVPYLQSDNKWQRILTIKTLGYLGDHSTKFKGKDSVEWLLNRLEAFYDKKMLLNAHQREIEEIIWALGWLKDERANMPIDRIRRLAGQNSLLWSRTIVPYKQIPATKKTSISPYEMGLIKQEKGDFIGAIVSFSKAIALNPTFANAYNNRGIAYESLQKHHKAIIDFSKAIALNSNNPATYNNRGNTYQNIGEYNKAIADYSFAIALDPKYPGAYVNRGRSYQALRVYSKAIVNYTKAIALDPNIPKTYINRGVTYQLAGQHSKAINDYSKAIALNPKFAGGYYNRGTVYKEIQQYSKALADFNKAIALDPRNSEAYVNKGLIYISLHQYQRAHQNFQIFLKIAPNHRGVPYVLRQINGLRAKNLIR